jgi:LysR family transcriptional regulator, mexEF-oprN operon transcriptional activator
VFDQGQIHHKRRALYADSFLCLFNSQQLPFTPPISLKDYLSVPHVLTSLTDDAHGAVDEVLAKLKLKRTIAMTTPAFLAVPFVVRRAPVITTMPSPACALLLRNLWAHDEPCPNGAADLHHLTPVACKF